MQTEFERLIERLSPANRAAGLDYLSDRAEDQQLEVEACKRRAKAYYLSGVTAALQRSGVHVDHRVDLDDLSGTLFVAPKGTRRRRRQLTRTRRTHPW